MVVKKKEKTMAYKMRRISPKAQGRVISHLGVIGPSEAKDIRIHEPVNLDFIPIWAKEETFQPALRLAS
jgi:hypothetical protein